MAGKRRISRWTPITLPTAVLACLAFAAPAAGAAPLDYTDLPRAASTFFVSTGGTDTGDCNVSPCATIEYALEQHRVSPATGDVIDIGPGSFAENVEANDPRDQGLTIRGTLDGSGAKQTTITGDGFGGSTCMVPCAVQIGAFPDIEVALEDVDVDNSTADDFVTPVSIEGGSDMSNVGATSQPSTNLFEVVALCGDPGTKIEDSVIDASGTSGIGITSDSGAVIRDTSVIAEEAPAIQQFPSFGRRPYRIVRSHLSTGPASGAPVLTPPPI